MIFRLVLTLTLKFLICEASKYSESFNSGSLFTEQPNHWNDWILQNATETLQGPVMDKRFLDFKILFNTSISFHLNLSISFSVQTPFKFKLSFINFNNETEKVVHYRNTEGKTWVHYTVIKHQEQACIFENSRFTNMFSVDNVCNIIVTSEKHFYWKIHEYPLRTSHHISEAPTTINVSPQIQYLTLYVYLCAHCYLEVRLSGDRHYILTETRSYLTQLWSPTSIVIRSEINITLVRKTDNGRYDGYWGIDFRLFEDNKLDLSNKETLLANETCDCNLFEYLDRPCQDSRTSQKVEFTYTKFKNFTLQLYWKVQNPCNIPHFNINVQNKTYKTTRFSCSIEGLDACSNYTIAVAAAFMGTELIVPTTKTIETKMEGRQFEEELFRLESSNFLFDRTRKMYKKISPCIKDLEWTDGNNKLQYFTSCNSFVDLPWTECTNDNPAENSTIIPEDQYQQSVKYMIKSLDSKPFELAVICLSEMSANLTFSLKGRNKDECDSSKLVILCKSIVKRIIKTDSSCVDSKLTWTDFTKTFEGKPPDYGFEILKNEEGIFRISFPILTNLDQNTFYDIVFKLHPVQYCHNETYPYKATVTHNFFNNTQFRMFKLCYTEEKKSSSSTTVCSNTNQNTTIFLLKPLRKYSISITSYYGITSYYTSSPTIFMSSFETKSGVPIVSKNLSLPSINGTTANFTLSKNMFSDDNGEIIAYALILLTKSVKLETDYGFWNGSKETWPSLPKNSMQLTPNFWNPFKNFSNLTFLTEEQNISFIIGSGETDFNPPLEANKDYWLFVRAFTQTGYKDSHILKINKTELVGHEVLLAYVFYGVIFTICSLLLLSVFSFAIFLFRKRKSTTRNDAETSFLLCDLEIFRAIEVIQMDQFLTEEFLIRIKQDFDTFKHEKTQPLTIALQLANIQKNRKREEFLPYDCNRVVLRNLPGVGRENYINASYIDGYNRTKAYIAAQGPKFTTIKCFWRMIWQENVEIIVMASNTFENEERMCAEYWPPKENAIFECGRIWIKSLSQTTYDCYTQRILQVSYNGTKRLITQFQIKWISDAERYFPNHLLPTIKFLQENDRVCSPILVHSGYGVGRTGAIILCDLALQMIKDKKKVDFYNLTQNLKRQRLFMVKELEHYALAHYTVREFLMDQQNPFKEFVNKQNIKHQLEYVDILSRHDSMLQRLIPKKEANGEQNLVVSALRYGGEGKFFVSQEPTMESFAPFWNMVAHESIEVIIFLNKKIPFRNFLHRGAKEVIELTFVKASQATFCTVLKFSLLIYNSATKEIIHERTVSVLEFSEWKQRKLVPRSIEHFVELVDAITKIVPPRPILILCSDGCTASGLFIVVSYVIDQFKSESAIDTCAAIRIARRSGTKFVDSEKQLKFVYKCVTKFCKNIDSYQTIDFL